MRKFLFVGLFMFLFLSACVRDSEPGDGADVDRPAGGLELTALATRDGGQQLTFFNVATMNVPAARAVLPVTGTPAEALRSIDYAPDGTLYGLGVLQAGDNTTQAALYTIDPLNGVASETARFGLPFVPDDIRFVPGSGGRQLRVSEFDRRSALPYTVLVNPVTGTVGEPLEIDAGQELGTRPALIAFDYTETDLLAITGLNVSGYVQHLARAQIGQEQSLTTVARVLTNLPYITSFVADGLVGYATLAEYRRPTGSPGLIRVNINPSSAEVGGFTELGSFPVSQLSIADTPESVVQARQEQ